MKANYYMNICRFFTLDLFQIKIVKLWFVSMVIVLTPLSLLQGYFFLQKFELNYFIQYGTIFFTLLYGLMCILYQPYTSNIITTHLHQIQLWKFEEAIEEIKEKTEKIWLFITVYMFIAIVLSLLLSVAYVIPTPSDKDFIFPLKLVELYFPQWENVIVWFISCGIFTLAYASVTIPVFTIFYFCGHINLQKLMLIRSIRNIAAKYPKLDHIGWNSTQYHREILKNLLFCVKTHVHLTKYGFRTLRLAEVYVIPFQIMGTILMASVVVAYFTLEDSLSDQYFRIAAIAVAGSTTLAGFAVSGQGIEDISQEYTDALCEVNWYHWNQNNKRMYLIFLMNATRMYKIKYTDNISLNYQLGLQVVRAVFSAISITYSLQQKRYS